MPSAAPVYAKGFDGLCASRPKLWRRRIAAFVCVPFNRSQAKTRPAITSRSTLPRPPHPGPSSVTVAKRSSVGQPRTEKFLQTGLDGANQLEMFNKSTISRNGGVLLSFLVCPEADRCAGLRRKRHRTGSVRLVATPSEAAAGATLSVAVFAHYQGAVGPQASQALIGSKQRNGPSAAGAGPSLGSVMCRGYQALSTNG